MRFLVIAVGKPRHSELAAAIEEYEGRAARYWPLAVHEVREEPARSTSADLVRQREGERVLATLGTGTRVVTCDAGGVQLSSERFAEWMQRERERAGGDVAFVIGGAFGLADAVRERAAMTLSFSSWTMPHEMARLVLAEQMYRAGSILRGEPYHK